MATQNNTKASAEATRDAQKVWNGFMLSFKVCGIAVAVTLILMAIFLA